MRTIKNFATGMIALIIGSAASSAHAAVIRIDDAGVSGSVDVLVADNLGAGESVDGFTTTYADTDATVGTTAFAGSAGGFAVDVASTFGQPFLMSAHVEGGAGTLRIYVSDFFPCHRRPAVCPWT